ncbi:MAG: hypothetical protein GWO08_11210 [Gammaproteobacteria bacterium]|nr:hypothetical protein [Gammaproteobacteria bacterium]NIW99506.1 hypothetical protein [Phycisphaerae bacterium]
MKKVDICIYQGEDFVYNFDALLDSNLDPIDISAYTAKMQMRRTPRAKIIELEIDETNNVTLGTDGVISISIPCGVNRHFDWTGGRFDIRLTDTSGDVSFPYYGAVLIQPAVTLNDPDFNNDFNCDFGP